MILLDTDICIEILRGNKVILEHYHNNDERAAIAFMSVGELYYGVEKSQYKERNRLALEEFMLSIDIINSDRDIMKKFGELKVGLYSNNLLLPDADILIAATALSKCTALITGNVRHYNRFTSLVILNWLEYNNIK